MEIQRANTETPQLARDFGQGWALDEAAWEPLPNLLTANAEVREFEEVLAAMPRLDAFVDASPTGCCFGKLCKIDGAAGPLLDKCASCGCEHHHLCATGNVVD